MRIALPALLSSLVLLSACAMTPVRVSQLHPAPPAPMVAKKAAGTLYIVIDHARVPDEYVIPKGELKQIDVFELRTFVKRDLKKAMESYFEKVEILDGAFPPAPAADHWVADVRIDKLDAKVVKAMDANNAGNVAAQIFGEMTWAFAVKRGDAAEYTYSFAGASLGTYSMTHVSETPKLFESTFEVAITSLLQGMVDKGADKAILGGG